MLVYRITYRIITSYLFHFIFLSVNHFLFLHKFQNIAAGKLSFYIDHVDITIDLDTNLSIHKDHIWNK